MGARRLRTIAITSGKGGVGKTNISVNLAISLQQMGHRVVVFDADLSLANAHIILGRDPERTILDALAQKRPFPEVLLDGPFGVKLLAGGSGLGELMNLSIDVREYIVSRFSDFDGDYDYLIVDTPAGIEDNVTDFVAACDRVVIVVVGEPTSFVDAYAAVKTLHYETQRDHFEVIVNMVENEAQGRAFFERFQAITAQFLQTTLSHLGSVPLDRALIDGVKRRIPVVQGHARSPAANAIRGVAAAIAAGAPDADAIDTDYLLDSHETIALEAGEA